MSSSAIPPGLSGAYTQAALSKLTVPQLKGLCKERKIPGYSKLGKQAILQKLVESGICATAGPETPTGSNPPTAITAAPSTALGLDHATLSGATPLGTGNTIGAGSTEGSSANVVTSRPPTKARKPKAKRLQAARVIASSDASGFSTAQEAGLSLLRSTNVDTGSIAAASQSTPSSGPQPIRTASAAAQTSIQSRVASFDRPPVLPNASLRRLRPSIDSMPPPAAKRPRLSSATFTPNESLDPVSDARLHELPKISTLAASVLRVTVDIPTKSQPSELVPLSAPAKRFRPLVVKKATYTASSAPHVTTNSASLTRLDTSVTVCNTEETSLISLADFVAPVPDLRPITLPPSLAQRKRVHRWAVILSGLSNTERAACCLVSRAFRYAVYLSASCILSQEFGGRRLKEDVLRKYSQAMTNMWPYLRAREAEVVQRRHVYDTSFLARFFVKSGLPDPIAPRLWSSPDHPKQLLTAVRFALTRVWFEMSVGSPGKASDHPDSWLHGTIFDTREVVEGEIWAVSIQYPHTPTRQGRHETLYVLEATCEVVGRSPPGAGERPVGRYPVRADWSAYISERVAAANSGLSLLSHLKWACQEDYDCGLSRLWLKRIAGEGVVGGLKKTVAERYVLACVVSNSVSGQWRTANEMAQEFAGLPERVEHPIRMKAPALNLYLPEHHHVESVHFTSARGDALHPAVAVVQTPHREYFILRDTGMQVGCEEEGVGPVWQEALRCDYKGLPLQYA